MLVRSLSGCTQHIRLYATQHLGQLIQTTPKANEWTLRLLLTQLYDPDAEVCEMAVHYLEEACEEMDILELVVQMQPTLDHLGETGHPLLLRLVPLG
jgi:rapamycin-insensitive companion of mTOR